MTAKYIIQKNSNTTAQAIQVAGPICHKVVLGDGLTAADCPDGLHAGQHATYLDPTWYIVGRFEPDEFTPAENQFDTQASAQAECDARNAA